MEPRYHGRVKLAALLVVAGCKITGTFPCTTDEQCLSGDTPGFCDNGYCAHFDIACPSGRRYYDGAAEMSGECTACTSFGRQLDTCMLMRATDPLVLSGANSYNTDTHVLTTPGGEVSPTHVVADQGTGAALDLLIVGSFTLSAGAMLRVDGQAGFGIVAFESIQIDGLIDLTAGGAGTRMCGSASGKTPNNDAGGGPGGGGGALGGNGGAGGDGDTDQTRTAGGAGGTLIARPTDVIGGCPGGDGGTADAAGGTGGGGGGALYLTAEASIKVSPTGVLNAGGGGGHHGLGAGIGGGGGGGGSGGMIVLESAIVQVMGVLGANGGGGGGGGGGSDGQPGSTTTAAAGGIGGSGGSTGGNGGTTGAGAVGADSIVSAGGGGGGCGFIAIASEALLATGTVSPPYEPWP